MSVSTRTRRFAALAVAATIAAFILGGCNLASERATRLEHQSFAIAGGAHTNLTVTTFNGHVSVTGKGDGLADVSVTAFGTGSSKDEAQSALTSVTVAIAQNGTSVSAIATASGSVGLGAGRGADVDVFLPPDASLTLTTSNGRIEAVNVNGTVTATSSNAAIVTRAGHDLHLETSNGAITLTDPAGTMVAHTSNGSVDILNAAGVVADVQTSNGSIAFSGSLASGDQAFRTSNASLALRLPAAQGFSLDARTSNGSATSDFVGVTANGTSLAGSVGDGAARISAQTSNGALSVTRLQP